MFVALGKRDRMNPKKLVDLIKERVEIQSREMDDIQVMDAFSFITVPFDKAEEIIVSFKEKGRKPIFTHAKEGKSKKPSAGNNKRRNFQKKK